MLEKRNSQNFSYAVNF